MRPTVRKISHLLFFRPDIFVNDPAYQLSGLYHAPEMSEVIWEVKRAFKAGIAPVKSEYGTTKTHILLGEDERPIAVFKIENYIKEYAAFRLDHKRFAKVPPTVITTLNHPVLGGLAFGSCQQYIEDGTTAVDIDSDLYKDFSSSSVRRIAQFDIRLINEDRHTSNMLIRDSTEIIPIDHGFILPNKLGRIIYTWVNWDQAATPFSEEEQAYISDLDPEKDRFFLIEEIGLKEREANRHYVASMLLKKAAAQGIYPNQIGGMISKSYPNSKFEILIQRLLQRKACDWNTFTKYVNEEIEAIL